MKASLGKRKTSLGEEPAWTLTAADLCDRCPARAVVETAKSPGGSLRWCGHHFAIYQNALAAFGATILVDERHR